jgi:hypothetical protein
MDPTGLLDAVLAVAVYPGALFVAVAAALYRRLAAQRRRPRSPGVPPPIRLVPAFSAVVASAMLPMVGSPALRLPPPAGAPGNVVAVVVLLAVATDLAAGSRAATALAAAAALPVLALAASLGTLDVAAVCTAGGAAGLAARAVPAVVLVLAASLVRGGRTAAIVASALALAGAALVVPSALRGQPPVLCALGCLGAVVVAGVLARLRRWWPQPLVAITGAAACAAGTALALLAVHP